MAAPVPSPGPAAGPDAGPSSGPVAGASSPWADAPPTGFVDLRAALDDACFDIRYAGPDNFTGAPLPGYEVPGAWLREAAAAALAEVQADLRRDGLSLLVFDAYRPRRATDAMVAWAEARGRTDLLRDGYIARRSNHARGDTVDVGLCDATTHAPLAMGTDFDTFSSRSRHGAVDGEAGQRRARLRRAMTAAGFSAYAREWWHYTAKDAAGSALDVPYATADVTG